MALTLPFKRYKGEDLWKPSNEEYLKKFFWAEVGLPRVLKR
jgi:hypothetical protein